MAPPFTKSLAALVAALAVASAAAADPSRKMELTADAATAEMELGFDSEGARRRALQGEYVVGNDDDHIALVDALDAEDQFDSCLGLPADYCPCDTLDYCPDY